MSDHLTTAISDALDHFQQELQGLRTGRASPNLIEELPVDCYGGRSSLQQIASISAPEPRVLLIQPWDPTVIKDIEKALLSSSLGITPVVDGKNIRLPFPAMTEERRNAMHKQLLEKSEHTKVRIRTAREAELKSLKTQERAGALSEDALTDSTKKVQAQIDQAMQQVAEYVEKKSVEIMTI